MFGGKKVRALTPRTPYQLPNTVVVVLCYGAVFAATGSGALKKVKRIVKKEDNLNS